MDQKGSVRLISPSGLHKPAGYSHVAAVNGGTLIYVAGQVALDAAGNLVGAQDFDAQVRQVFANVAAALGSVGATFKDVIKLNYYCADSIDPAVHLPVVRAVRDTLVDPAAPPASTFVVVRRLVNPEWLIEVEAVAVVASA